MKRSEINNAIETAKKMMDTYNWTLPKWGYWSKEDYNNNPEMTKYLKDHQMGWDVTDFGKDKIADYKMPTEIKIVDAIPLKNGFKIDRSVLKDLV